MISGGMAMFIDDQQTQRVGEEVRYLGDKSIRKEQ